MSSIRIRPDQEILIKKLGINLSHFIKEKLDEIYQDPQRVKEEINDLKAQINVREELLKGILKERTKFTKKEIEYLISSKTLLKEQGKDSQFFINRFNGFIQQFDKKFISLEIFEKLVVASK